MPAKLVFALTGGIASGKTLVSKVFISEGVGIIDADKIARKLVEPGSRILQTLVETFGKGILQDGGLDRKKLGNRVFGSRTELARLDSIMVPAIVERIDQELKEKTITHEAVCIDAPTLFEHNLHLKYRPVVLVVSPPEAQLRRVMLRGFTAEEAQARINAQLSVEKKRSLADHIIDNKGELGALRESSFQVLKALRSGV